MRGKVVVATGATSGIGEKTVEAFAQKGARIVLIARDRSRADRVLARLGILGPNVRHSAYMADLALMAEAKRVAAEIAAVEPAIDILINNAGAIFAERRATAEGLERTFALNHMSYFIDTRILLERLKARAGRVISTASEAHRGAVLEFNDLQGIKSYSGWRAYQRSKLANILFTRELARRLQGGSTTANCLHPGVVSTRFANGAGGWIAPFFSFAKHFARPPERGADTMVYLAVSPNVAGMSGQYFIDGKPASPSGAARDMESARRLWDISEKLMAAG